MQFGLKEFLGQALADFLVAEQDKLLCNLLTRAGVSF